MSDSQEEHKYFVYKHTSPSNKVYIGITQMNPEYRWNHGKGYIKNQYFYRAIQKYGWDNFRHEILFSELTKEEACSKEIELIALYDSTNPDAGYNISLGGELGNLGLVVSEETRKKMSESTKGEKNPMFGKHHTLETCEKIGKNRDYPKGKEHPGYGLPIPEYIIAPLLKPVIQLDKDGKFIEEYPSTREAARRTQICNSEISLCCNQKRQSAGGFMWVFKQEYDPENIEYKCVLKTTRRPVVQLSMDGTFIKRFSSMKTAAEETGVSRHIRDCCCHKRKSCGGFKWMFEDEYIELLNTTKEELL